MNIKKLSVCRTITAAILLSFTALPSQAQLFEKGLNLLKKEAKKEAKKAAVDAANEATDGKLKKVTNNSLLNKATNGKARKVTRTTSTGIKRTPGKNYYTDDAWHEAVAKKHEDESFKYDTINNVIYKLDPRYGDACLYGIEDVMQHEMKEVTVLGHIRYKGRSYTVTEIAGRALSGEPLLTKVTLPPTIKEIGPDAFNGDIRLTEINVPGSVKIIKRNAFAGTGIKTLKLNAGLKTIEGNAFASSKIERIEIPNTVTDLQTYAFYACEKLAEITLPKGIKEITPHTFQYCISLKSIVIPEGVTTIREGAFWQCKSLEKVTFPSTLKLIEDDAFSDCPKLKTPMPAGVKVESFFDD